ncbi:hypothetical protein [Nakamurella leprariae]|uniref:Uncharacterized protein n=1 Tax=Nakamurella leprariae TaxID=2803911 RepID=A0A938YFF0_9ACTN|nr:hypothetical protein [Nakamurella leprariae]MBM9468546.1 hypothetical protein [Nakamurella leprariae]
MAQRIFVNLPATDGDHNSGGRREAGLLDPRPVLGDTTVSAVTGDVIVVLLLEREGLRPSRPERPVSEPGGQVVMLLALSAEAGEGVDRILETVLANGATPTGGTRT